MSKIELDVLFKKMQKDDKKEMLEFHIIDEEIPHSMKLIEMAGGMSVIEVNDQEKIAAEFKKLQRDSKKTVLQFEVKGDNEERIIALYKLAGSHVDLNLEPSQMTTDEFYNESEHEGIEYSVDTDGTVEVLDGQMAIDDLPIGEPDDVQADDDELLN